MISPTTVPGISTTSAIAPISTAVAALPTRLTRTLLPTTILPISVNRSRPTSMATAQAVRHSREHEGSSRQAIRPGEQQRNHAWHHEEPREGQSVGHREDAVFEPSCFVWPTHTFIGCPYPEPYVPQIIPPP